MNDIYTDSGVWRDIHAACSVRVSNELGAGNPKAAAFSVKVVTMLSLTVAAIIAVIVMCLRDYLSYVFTKGEEVAHAVSTMTPLLAVTIVLNGIQPVLSGINYTYRPSLSIVVSKLPELLDHVLTNIVRYFVQSIFS